MLGRVRGPAQPGDGDILVLPQRGDLPPTERVLPRRREAHRNVSDQKGGRARHALSFGCVRPSVRPSVSRPVLTSRSLDLSLVCRHLSHVDPSRICSRGYWDAAADHPSLLAMSEEVEEDEDVWRMRTGGAGRRRNRTVTIEQLIREELFLYAKKNMALVNVYIKVCLSLKPPCTAHQMATQCRLSRSLAGPSGDSHKARPKDPSDWLRGQHRWPPRTLHGLQPRLSLRDCLSLRAQLLQEVRWIRHTLLEYHK